MDTYRRSTIARSSSFFDIRLASPDPKGDNFLFQAKIYSAQDLLLSPLYMYIEWKYLSIYNLESFSLSLSNCYNMGSLICIWLEMIEHDICSLK